MNKRREQWTKKTAPIIEAMGGEDHLEKFRSEVERVFEIRTRDGKHNRCPSVGLRLYDEGHAGMLSCAVGWSPRHKEAIPSTVRCEALVGLESELRGKKAYSGYRSLWFTLTPGEVRITRFRPSDAVSTGMMVRRIMADYLEEPESVLGRCSFQCCICGRGLSDPQSISRGIGPECVQGLPFYAFKAPVVTKPAERVHGWQ